MCSSWRFVKVKCIIWRRYCVLKNLVQFDGTTMIGVKINVPKLSVFTKLVNEQYLLCELCQAVVRHYLGI